MTSLSTNSLHIMATPAFEDKIKYAGDPPPTPPDTDDSASSTSSRCSITDISFAMPPPTNPPTAVLDQDKKTPDAHVPRDPRLIRLTGVHPFNVEPPLSTLFNEGFLTSPEMFYVRNHGPVPEVHDADVPDWEFSIEGYACNRIRIHPEHSLTYFQTCR